MEDLSYPSAGVPRTPTQGVPMRSPFVVLVAASVAVLSSGCAAPAGQAGADSAAATAAAKQQVEKRMNDYLVVMRANQFDSLAPFWTPDMQLYENAMEVKGRAAFDDVVADVKKTMTLTSIDLTSTDVFVHDGGKVAYQYGHYTEGMAYKDGKKKPEVAHNNFVAQWMRDSAGVWRMSRFTATPMPEPPAAAKK